MYVYVPSNERLQLFMHVRESQKRYEQIVAKIICALAIGRCVAGVEGDYHQVHDRAAA